MAISLSTSLFDATIVGARGWIGGRNTLKPSHAIERVSLDEHQTSATPQDCFVINPRPQTLPCLIVITTNRLMRWVEIGLHQDVVV